ncbi:MAG: hypothetical protein H0U74_00380 [Bradymonadaceae bacterium]|nr:hypothetical protein [Lujinxingiaceae bacterium]
MLRKILLLVLASLFFASPGFAQTGQPMTFGVESERHLWLGDMHYLQGDLYRAISEYQTFLFERAGDERAAHVRLKIAWLYGLANEHRSAARLLDAVAMANAEEPLGWWSRYYFAHVALNAGRPEIAKLAFDEVLSICAQTGRCDELTAQTQLGLADYYAGRHEFVLAAGELAKLPPNAPAAEEAARISRQLLELKIPSKSPAIAGLLSIVPGFGHLYIEEYGIGMLAMIWNGVFIYGIVDSILAGSYGQALLIGLIESIWYGGTIFGAIAGAQRFNRDAMQIVESGLRRDVERLRDEQPWPARFPLAYPTPMQLRLEF